MPIPKPRAGEKQEDYHSRCMSAIHSEYPQEQANAICYSQWREHHKTIDTATGLVAYDLQGQRKKQAAATGAPKRLYGLIEKVEEQNDGTIRVHGVASSEEIDDQGEVVRAAAMRDALPSYMAFPSLREMHQLSAAGTTLEANVHDDGCTRIVAHVVDPVAVSKVKNKVYRGFSIGGTVTQRDHVDRSIITGLKLNEISLVDRPANPRATLDLWKAGQNIEGKSDMADGGLGTLGEALAAAQVQAAQKPIPEAAPPPVDDVRQRWIASDGSEHVTKAGALKRNADLQEVGAFRDEARTDEPLSIERVIERAQAAITAGTEALNKAESRADEDEAGVHREPAEDTKPKEIEDCDKAEEREDREGETDKASDDDGKKPYGDVSYADPGYQSDGKKRYPIDTAAHIRAAWNYINKPKNSGKYSSDQVARIKARIVTAWKKKIDSKGPPSAQGKKTSRPDVKKSIWDIGEIANMVAAMRALSQRMEAEAVMEDDESGTPAKAWALCTGLVELLRNVVAEETAEILDATEIDEPISLASKTFNSWRECISKSSFDTKRAEALVKNLQKARRMTADQVHLALFGHTMKTMMDMDGPSRADHVYLAAGLQAGRNALELAGGRMPDEDDEADKAAEVESECEPGIDSGATQIAAPPSEGPPRNATQDTGDNSETEPPQDSDGAVPREPVPKASDDHLLDGFLTKASAVLAGSAVSARDTAAFMGRVDSMLKAGAPPHKILMDVAHACLDRVSDGATCKAEAPRPARHTGELMAHLDNAHGALTRMEGCAKCGPGGMGMGMATAVGDVTKTQSPKEEPREQIAKAFSEAEVKALIDDAVAEAVIKAVAARGSDNTEILMKTVGQLTEIIGPMARQVEAIAKTEVPPKALARLDRGSLAKTGDTGGLVDESIPQVSAGDVAKMMATMNPAQRERFMFDLQYKASLNQGPIKVASMAMQERPQR